MRKHILMLAISDSKDEILLFKHKDWSYWNGLSFIIPRAAAGSHPAENATALFHKVTGVEPTGWSYLGQIKSSRGDFVIDVVFTILSVELDKKLETAKDPERIWTWNWVGFENLDDPDVMDNIRWLAPMILDRSLQRPFEIIYSKKPNKAERQ